MSKPTEFQGLCPICYLPVKVTEDSRTIENDSRQETYHANCVHKYVADRLPTGLQNAGLSILEEHVQKIMLEHLERRMKRLDWVSSNISSWLEKGNAAKHCRESYGKTLKATARELGISPGRLKRFEEGQPVKDANLLFNAYTAVFYNLELELRLQYADKVIAEKEQQYEIAYNLLVDKEVERIKQSMINNSIAE